MYSVKNTLLGADNFIQENDRLGKKVLLPPLLRNSPTLHV